jgi:branched-chain amino acid transport system substrate-binding protein
MSLAAEDKTYQLGNKALFQLYTPASHFTTTAMDVIKEKNPQSRAALIFSDDGFSKTVAVAASEDARRLGLQVVLDELYPPSTADFGAIINKAIAAKADVLVGGGHFADGTTLARQVFDRKAAMKFICLIVAPASEQFAELGDAAVGVTYPSHWEPSVAYEPQFGPSSAAFAKAFQEKFGQAADYHAAAGYAAGLVLGHAVEQAGTLDPAKVIEALNATDATIFFGHIKFATDPANHGLQIGHQMVLVQWQKRDGHLVKEVVSPTGAQTAELLYQ